MLLTAMPEISATFSRVRFFSIRRLRKSFANERATSSGLFVVSDSKSDNMLSVPSILNRILLLFYQLQRYCFFSVPASFKRFFLEIQVSNAYVPIHVPYMWMGTWTIPWTITHKSET
jgi:hypothetical protein